MKWYQIEFEDENFELVEAENEKEAWLIGMEMKKEHGTVFQVDESDYKL